MLFIDSKMVCYNLIIKTGKEISYEKEQNKIP